MPKFRFLPKTYFDTREQANKLKAPPKVVLGCYAVQGVLAIASFTISIYLGLTTYFTETVVTFEPLSAPYYCVVLSPRDDNELFSTVSSSAAQYSSMRYTYDQCYAFLSPGTTDSVSTSSGGSVSSSSSFTGKDVCASGVRRDLTLSVVGVSASNTNCEDILLMDNMRFCFGSEAEQSFGDFSTQFPRQGGAPTAAVSADSHYFMNSSSSLAATTPTYEIDEVLSEFVSDGKQTVYVIAEVANSPSQRGIYQISQETSPSPTLLFEIPDPDVHGLAVSDTAVFAYAVSAGMGKVHKYRLSDGVRSEFSVDCSAFAGQSTSSTEISRFLSVGDDGMLYAMCSDSTLVSNTFSTAPDSDGGGYYTFFQVNPNTGSTRDIHTDVFQFNYTLSGAQSARSIDKIAQILAMGGYAYLDTGRDHNANLLRVDLSVPPTATPSEVPTMSPTTTSAPSPDPGPPPGAGPGPVVKADADRRSRVMVASSFKAQAQVLGTTMPPAAQEESLSPEQQQQHHREEQGFLPQSASAISMNTIHTANKHRRLQPGVPPPDPPYLQPIVFLGTHEGTHISRGIDADGSFSSTLIYEHGYAGRSYDITTGIFLAQKSSGSSAGSTYGDVHYMPTAVQQALYYQICGDEYTDFVIDPDFDQDFSSQCGEINSVHYQTNSYFPVPSCCRSTLSPSSDGTITSADVINNLLTCAEMAVSIDNFTSVTCEASFDPVCTAAYTDNPPFSCEKSETNSLLAIIANAFSYATAVWTFAYIAINILLEKLYPNGYTNILEDDDDGDQNGEKDTMEGNEEGDRVLGESGVEGEGLELGMVAAKSERKTQRGLMGGEKERECDIESGRAGEDHIGQEEEDEGGHLSSSREKRGERGGGGATASSRSWWSLLWIFGNTPARQKKKDKNSEKKNSTSEKETNIGRNLKNDSPPDDNLSAQISPEGARTAYDEGLPTVRGKGGVDHEEASTRSGSRKGDASAGNSQLPPHTVSPSVSPRVLDKNGAFGMTRPPSSGSGGGSRGKTPPERVISSATGAVRQKPRISSPCVGGNSSAWGDVGVLLGNDAQEKEGEEEGEIGRRRGSERGDGSRRALLGESGRVDSAVAASAGDKHAYKRPSPRLIGTSADARVHPYLGVEQEDL